MNIGSSHTHITSRRWRVAPDPRRRARLRRGRAARGRRRRSRFGARDCQSLSPSARGSHSLEAVDDQSEAELELILFILTDADDVLFGVLSEVRVSVGGQPRQEGEEVGDVFFLDRVTCLPKRESKDVAIEGVIAVIGGHGGEARFTKASEYGVDVTQTRGQGP